MTRNTPKNPAQGRAPQAKRAPRAGRSRIDLREGDRAEGGPGWACEAKTGRLSLSQRIRHWKLTLPDWGYLCLFIVLSLAGILSARYGNPAAGTNPASRGTVPPSSYASNTLPTLNPVDNAGNLVMTGNVSGGKAFRGNVPYTSPTSFSGPLGSTSLDSFRRYSAVPPELSDSPSGYTPFYSPTGTVSTIQPGTSGVFAPGSPRIAGTALPGRSDQPSDVMPVLDTPPSLIAMGRKVDVAPGDSFTPLPLRAQASSESLGPLALKTPEEMRRLIASASASPTAERSLALQSQPTIPSGDYRRQVDQLQGDFDRVKTNASQFEQDLQTGKQASVAQGIDQKSANSVPLSISADALRRVLPAQGQLQSQPPTPNPPADQDLSLKTTALSPEGSAGPGLLPGQTAAGSSGSLLKSASPSPVGAGTTAATPGLGSSSAEMAALQNRIHAAFASQPEETATEKPDASGSNLRPPGPDPALTRAQAPPGASTVPALPRVEETVRAFDTAGKTPEHPLQNSAGNVPAAAGNVSPPAAARATPPTAPNSGGLGTGSRPQVQGQPSLPPPPAPEVKVDPAAKAKYDDLMLEGRRQMQQGRYSQAAQCFLYAHGYNPRDAKAEISRTQALLAAGEYVSSAFSLTQAIELDARMALAKSDLVETLGGADRCVKRLAELKQYTDQPDCPPGLQLLLAYVYQQMDRPQEARAAVQVAKKGMPTSQAPVFLEASLPVPK